MATMAETLASVNAIWQDASNNAQNRNAIGVIIQPFIDRKLFGHISNEWRVSRDSVTWLSETSVGGSSERKHLRVTGSQPAGDERLDCTKPQALEARLRAVARRLSDLPFRHHLEWVWSGDRLWVVQSDRVAPTPGAAPGDGWTPTVGRPLNELRLWRRISSLAGDDSLMSWGKVRALHEFAMASLPVPAVWAIANSQLIAGLANGSAPVELVKDIELLCSGHIIIRTDVKSSAAQFMLPKSDAIADSTRAVDFMAHAIRGLLAAGVQCEDICLLVHRFVRARGGAWARADPGKSIVQVDSNWGLADGLSWLPHDEAFVNVKSGDVRRSTAGKTSFLDISEGGGSQCRESPTEWIWRSSMTEDQLRIVALGTSRLADQAKRPILTMWFIGMQDGAETDCLPWFQTTKVLDMEDGTSVLNRSARNRICVRTIDDLDCLGDLPEDSVVRIQPEKAALLRDKEFLDQVVRVLSNRTLTIEIVGSTLGHAYYMLRRSGLSVTCVDRFEPPSAGLNKLVRDDMPQLIGATGESVTSYQAAGRERDRLMRTKIVEEAIELMLASDDDLLDEMADVGEAVEAFRRHRRLSRDDVRERQREKRHQRGGFDSGQVIVSTRFGSALQDGDQPALPGLDVVSSAMSWSVHTSGGQLLLNLIPPARDEPKVYTSEVGDLPVAVEYRGYVVSITPRSIEMQFEFQDHLF